MKVKSLFLSKSSDVKGIAPVIGTAVTIFIVFILAGLVSSVFFEGYGDSPNKKSPAAKLQIFFTEDGNSLRFEHNGGDQLFFDSSSISVIMDVNDVSYPLNASVLGTLEAGKNGILDLNKSELPAMELKPEDSVFVKVVDPESGGLVAKRELEIKGQIYVIPE